MHKHTLSSASETTTTTNTTTQPHNHTTTTPHTQPQQNTQHTQCKTHAQHTQPAHTTRHNKRTVLRYVLFPLSVVPASLCWHATRNPCHSAATGKPCAKPVNRQPPGPTRDEFASLFAALAGSVMWHQGQAVSAVVNTAPQERRSERAHRRRTRAAWTPGAIRGHPCATAPRRYRGSRAGRPNNSKDRTRAFSVCRHLHSSCLSVRTSKPRACCH